MSGPDSAPEGPKDDGPPHYGVHGADEVAGVDGSDAADRTAQPPPTSATISQAYSAPESEQFVSGPYVPAEQGLYDYDDYQASHRDEEPVAPRWPWVVGVAAIVAAVALVASVGLLVVNSESTNTASPTTSSSRPPVQDEITTTTTTTTTTPPPPPPTTTEAPPPPPPPPPPETVTVTPPPPPVAPAPPEAPPPDDPAPPATTSAAPTPRQVTYTVTGTKAPGDIISVTYVDAAGRSRTLNNVFIPWAMTVTPISASEVGSVQASSLFWLSRLNCEIRTSDGQVLSSSANNAPQTSC